MVDYPSRVQAPEIFATRLNDYMQHQGKYPVIFITFKDIKNSDLNAAYGKLYELIIDIFDEHNYLKESDKLSTNIKNSVACCRVFCPNSQTYLIVETFVHVCPFFLINSLHILEVFLYYFSNYSLYFETNTKWYINPKKHAT